MRSVCAAAADLCARAAVVPVQLFLELRVAADPASGWRHILFVLCPNLNSTNAASPQLAGLPGAQNCTCAKVCFPHWFGLQPTSLKPPPHQFGMAGSSFKLPQHSLQAPTNPPAHLAAQQTTLPYWQQCTQFNVKNTIGPSMAQCVKGCTPCSPHGCFQIW